LSNHTNTYIRRDWREKQQEEIKARDEASKARRQETISKAEGAIDEFYENYSKKKERNIGENKYALSPNLVIIVRGTDRFPQGPRNRIP
jgi:hypothetical protein